MFCGDWTTATGPTTVIRSGAGCDQDSNMTEMTLVHIVGKAENQGDDVDDETRALATEGYPEMVVSYRRVGELLVLLRCSAMVDGRVHLSVSSWSLHDNNYKEVDLANTQVLVPDEPTAFVVPARRDVNPLKLTLLATMRSRNAPHNPGGDGACERCLIDVNFFGTYLCRTTKLSVNDKLHAGTSTRMGNHTGPYACLAPPPPRPRPCAARRPAERSTSPSAKRAK